MKISIHKKGAHQILPGAPLPRRNNIARCGEVEIMVSSLYDHRPRYTSLQAIYESLEWLIRQGVVELSTR